MRERHARRVCATAGFLILTCVGAGWGAAVVEPTARSTTNERPRDPFWPIGYAPPAAAGADAASLGLQAENQVRANEAEWVAAQKLLVVKGVMRSGRAADSSETYGVLINGKLIEAGGVVSVIANGKTFRWRIIRVTEDGPVYERVTNAVRRDGH